MTALSTHAGRGWQPIETAPKDGTTVLLFTTHIADDWIDETFSKVQTGYWDPGSVHLDPRFKRPAGWQQQFIGVPSHWMPLPSPPDAAEGRG